MRPKAEKTKNVREDDSAPEAKMIKVEPTTESSNSDKICKMCGKVHNYDDMFKNLPVFPKDGRYRCHYCSESFSYSCLFSAHVRECSTSYADNVGADLNSTTPISTGTTIVKAEKNLVSISTGFSQFIAVPEVAIRKVSAPEKYVSRVDNNRFKCDVCNRSFTSEVILKNHVERMHGAECEFCRKKYSSLADLLVHKKTHVGAKPYQCQYCDQTFMTQYMVTEHERIHTGDTPYRCEFCNRGFSYRSNLIVHKRIHDSKRNHFECDQCGQTFQHGAQLTRHKLVHTTDKPLDCRHCGKSFVIYNKLIEHIKEEHKK